MLESEPADQAVAIAAVADESLLDSVGDSSSAGSDQQYCSLGEDATVDRSAVERCTDNPVTIEDLVDRYGGDVYAYAMRLTADPTESDDLTQATFLCAYQSLGQLRDADRARSWLLAITRNGFLKTLRQRRWIDEASLPVDLSEIVEQPDPPEVIDGQTLQIALQRLSADHRMILGMFYFEDFSYRQIAAELDISMGTVMSRMSRAKQALRRHLIELQQSEISS